MLLNCSTSLVRTVEQGQAGITQKLADKICACTGVSVSWLATKHQPELPILAEDGKILTHEAVIAKIQNRIKSNHEHASKVLLMGPSAILHRDQPGVKVSSGIKRKMANTMAKIVEESIYLELQEGETGLMEEITKLLANRSRQGGGRN